MLYRSHKLFSLLLCFFALAASARAQDVAPDSQTRERLEREVTRLLLAQDVGEVANQLARERAVGVTQQLLRLSIFARAGQHTRFLATLNRLTEASDMPPVSHRWVVAEAVKELIGTDDLQAWKTYYERIMPIDASGAEKLLALWEAVGDARELDAWLAERARQNGEWLQWRIRWRAKLGTAGELLDAFAADAKAHPRDSERVFLYLRANDWANHPQSTEWLADFFEAWLNDDSAERAAYELYELGRRLKTELPPTAAKMFERSLATPFTERDQRLIRERVIIRFQVAPRVKDWDKQLRYWTKRQLTEVYRSLNQPEKAQPLVEELVSMKTDDIMTEDVHRLAGAVQAASGARVVEAKVLRDEATEQGTAAYWANRARYYAGRKEYDAVMETYRRALSRLPARPLDNTDVSERLALLMDFAHFVAYGDVNDDLKRQAARAELKEVLRREFASTPPEALYAFGVARIVLNSEFDLDDLRDELFVKDKDALARVLAGREAWGSEEELLAESIICREAVAAERRAEFWTQLEPLAKAGNVTRAYRLAEIMSDCQEPRRAVPFFLDYLKRLKEGREDGADFWRESAESSLFSAYLKAGDWQAGEKLLLGREDLAGRQLMSDLGHLALAAARSGAVNDAVRFWRLKANLDRRQLDDLGELAKTKAREPLREMYATMKKKDPLSSVPDAALRLLQ